MINIVCACDDKYVRNMGAMICSVVYNSNKENKLRFFIIDVGISKIHKRKLEKFLNSIKANYQFIISFKEEVKVLRVDKHISSATYYRLYISTLLSNQISKVIYLDSDVIVAKDIADLWNIDITNFSIGAKREYPNIKRNQYLGMAKEAPYFNAGVLLINLENWRKQNLSGEIISYIQQHSEKLNYHDQDGLNAILHQDCKQIPSEWNTLSQDVYGNYLKVDPNIIHYTEASKPWHLLNNHPYKNEYEKYLAMTPWKDDIPPENDIILKLLEVKKIIIFGSGGSGIRLLERIKELNGQVSYFLDNNKKLFDNSVCGTVTYLPNKLKEENLEDVFIFIASMYYVDIEKQLIDMGLKRLKHFVSLGFESELIEEW